MKRSEMIELLSDEIDNIIEAYITREHLIVRAEYLLTKLEDIGMRPPVSGDLDAQMRAARLNKWETEDKRSDNADFKSSNCDNNNGPCACGAWHETK